MSLYGYAFVISILRRIVLLYNCYHLIEFALFMSLHVFCQKKVNIELLYYYYHPIEFALFMSLYGFAFVISVLRRISFDINSHPKTTKNTCLLSKKVHIELLYCYYHLVECALFMSLCRISFDIHGHPKKKTKNTCCFC